MPAPGLYRGQIGLALASSPGRAEAIISLALRNTRVARLLKTPWRELPLIVYTFVLYIQLSGLSDRESGRFLKKAAQKLLLLRACGAETRTGPK
jgi:hypothetical protein